MFNPVISPKMRVARFCLIFAAVVWSLLSSTDTNSRFEEQKCFTRRIRLLTPCPLTAPLPRVFHTENTLAYPLPIDSSSTKSVSHGEYACLPPAHWQLLYQECFTRRIRLLTPCPLTAPLPRVFHTENTLAYPLPIDSSSTKSVSHGEYACLPPAHWQLLYQECFTRRIRLLTPCPLTAPLPRV